MKMNRVWAMPNKNTFEIPVIRAFVKRYIQPNTVSIDPFARDSQMASITNDLNPNTKAMHHKDALDFLRMCQADGVAADLVIFDPPYSYVQMKECYANVGRPFTSEESWRASGWRIERNTINNLLRVGGIVLTFGWNTVGMGVCRFYEIVEILLVCHGRAHNDTICVAEKKLCHQEDLFAPTQGEQTALEDSA